MKPLRQTHGCAFFDTYYFNYRHCGRTNHNCFEVKPCPDPLLFEFSSLWPWHNHATKSELPKARDGPIDPIFGI